MIQGLGVSALRGFQFSVLGFRVGACAEIAWLLRDCSRAMTVLGQQLEYNLSRTTSRLQVVG